MTNRKPAHRRGKVQLIDGSGWSQPLRKNLGKKNCELKDEEIRLIMESFLAFDQAEESDTSKIFPNAAFGYWKVTVERPLRLRVDLGAGALRRLKLACGEAGESDLAAGVERAAAALGPGPHGDYNDFVATLDQDGDCPKLTSKRVKLLREVLTETDETAQPVIKKVHSPKKMGADPLRGLYAVTVDGKPAVVEYEADTALRDTEQVPLLEEGGVDAFLAREVLPHVADAWMDASKTQIGYEISFTRYFYKPQPLRTLAEIRADVLALEQETEGLLDEILGADITMLAEG